MTRDPSRTLTDADAALIKALLAAGWLQSDIAALVQCNGGRISDINKGYKFRDIQPANFKLAKDRAYILETLADWTADMTTRVLETIDAGKK